MDRQVRDAEGEIRQAIRRLGYELERIEVDDDPRYEDAYISLDVAVERENEHKVK